MPDRFGRIFKVMIHKVSRNLYERLREEHADLTTRGRISAAEKIARAREHGDLKENGDYHAAKDEHGHMEGRIRQLESILKMLKLLNHQPMARSDSAPLLRCSTTVTIHQWPSYLIGHIEEKCENAEVMSPTSPLGAALLGAKKNDLVTYAAPNGNLKVKIIETRQQ